MISSTNPEVGRLRRARRHIKVNGGTPSWRAQPAEGIKSERALDRHSGVSCSSLELVSTQLFGGVGPAHVGFGGFLRGSWRVLLDSAMGVSVTKKVDNGGGRMRV